MHITRCNWNVTYPSYLRANTNTAAPTPNLPSCEYCTTQATMSPQIIEGFQSHSMYPKSAKINGSFSTYELCRVHDLFLRPFSGRYFGHPNPIALDFWIHDLPSWPHIEKELLPKLFTFLASHPIPSPEFSLHMG